MDRGLWSRSAVELAAMIRAREVSCVEVTESVLGRIAAHNGRLNAIVSDCSEEAIRSAGKGTGKWLKMPRSDVCTGFR